MATEAPSVSSISVPSVCNAFLRCMLGGVLQALLLRPIRSQPLLSAACFGWTSAWLLDELVRRRSDAKPDPLEPAPVDEDATKQDVGSDGDMRQRVPPAKDTRAQTLRQHPRRQSRPADATRVSLQGQTMRRVSRGLRTSSGGRTGRACCGMPRASTSVRSRTQQRTRGACR